jgi:hypothetical protein
MAKYFVLEAHQDPQSRAHRHVKKSAAETLLRKNLARRVAHNIIQMIAVREAILTLTPAPQVTHVAQEAYKTWATKLRDLCPSRVQRVNKLKAPEGLLITYPLPDQRTVYL